MFALCQNAMNLRTLALCGPSLALAPVDVSACVRLHVRNAIDHVRTRRSKQRRCAWYSHDHRAGWQTHRRDMRQPQLPCLCCSQLPHAALRHQGRLAREPASHWRHTHGLVRCTGRQRRRNTSDFRVPAWSCVECLYFFTPLYALRVRLRASTNPITCDVWFFGALEVLRRNPWRRRKKKCPWSKKERYMVKKAKVARSPTRSPACCHQQLSVSAPGALPTVSVIATCCRLWCGAQIVHADLQIAKIQLS